MRQRNQDLTAEIKQDVLRILNEQRALLEWLKERSEELKLMLIIYKDDKENLDKTKAKLDFIVEILGVMNNRGEKK